MTIKHDTITLGGVGTDCIGEMDSKGFVFIWGQSGNGKTSAVMMFCKELVKFGKVLYLSEEEGYSLSMQNTLRRFSMNEADSIQKFGLTFSQYLLLSQTFPNKLFVLISQAKGKEPDGRPAFRMKYLAGLKIWVEGYTAFSKGRFIGATGKAVIWEEGARDYWGTTE